MKEKKVSVYQGFSFQLSQLLGVLSEATHTHKLIQHPCLGLYYAVIAVLINYSCDPGFLFRQPDCAVVAVNYLKKSYEVYQAYCKVNAAPREDQTMTCRHLLWMFRVQQTVTRRLPYILTSYSFLPLNIRHGCSLCCLLLQQNQKAVQFWVTWKNKLLPAFSTFMITLCWLVYCNPCQDLHLLDNNLTTARLLQVITAESRDHRNLSSCLDLEVRPWCLHQLTNELFLSAHWQISIHLLTLFLCIPFPLSTRLLFPILL